MLTEDFNPQEQEETPKELDDIDLSFLGFKTLAYESLIDEIASYALNILNNPKTYQYVLLVGFTIGYFILVTIGGGLYQVEMFGIGNIMVVVGTLCTLSLFSHKIRKSFLEYVKGFLKEVIGD